MTYDEMLDAHVREYDRITARVRTIMFEKGYDNDESPEMRGLKEDMKNIIARAFVLKCCYGRAEGIVAKEAPGLFKP